VQISLENSSPRELRLSSDTAESRYEWLGFSIKSILLIIVGIFGLGIYMGILLFGDNSLLVLNRLGREKEALIKERIEIKASSQKLQKEYFELLQLTE